MRSFFIFFLSMILTLNTAFAAVSGICDALDHLPKTHSGTHTEARTKPHLHMSHHSHNSPDSSQNSNAEKPMATDQHAPAGAKLTDGHCHAHSTPASADFTESLPTAPSFARHVQVTLPVLLFTSFIPAGLDRPPQDRLA